MRSVVLQGSTGASSDQVFDPRTYGTVGSNAANTATAIDAAITAATAKGGIVQLPAGSFNDAGGHVLPVNVCLVGPNVGACSINHTGNNTWLQVNAPGATEHRVGAAGFRLIGNSGASAVGIEIRDTSYGAWVNHVRVRDYTAGVGILLHNATTNNYVEGFDTDDLSISNCAIGVEFRRTNGTESFNGTRMRGFAINVPANGIGILNGGSNSTGECRIYNSWFEGEVWLGGNNAVAFRNGANGNVYNTFVWIHGEEQGAITGIISLRNNEGGKWVTSGPGIRFNTPRGQFTPANTFVNTIWAAGSSAGSAGTNDEALTLVVPNNRNSGVALSIRSNQNANPFVPNGTSLASFQIADSGEITAKSLGLVSNNFYSMLGGILLTNVFRAPTQNPDVGSVFSYVESGVQETHDHNGLKMPVSGPDAAHARHQDYWLNGAGTVREGAIPRWGATGSITPTGGTLYIVALPLEIGQVVTNLIFATAGSGFSNASNNDGHWWFALYDMSLGLISQTADQGSASLSGGSAASLALSSPFTCPTSGVYYAGIMMNIGTGTGGQVASLCGVNMANGGAITTGTGLSGKLLGGKTGSTSLGATAPAGALSFVSSTTIPYVAFS